MAVKDHIFFVGVALESSLIEYFYLILLRWNLAIVIKNMCIAGPKSK